MVQRRNLAVLIVLVCAWLLLLYPPQTVFANESLTVSAAALAKVGTAAAAQYVVKNNREWPNYSSVLALSVLAETEKAAANEGRALSSQDAQTVVNTAKTVLDGLTSQAQEALKKGAANGITYGVNQLFTQSLSLLSQLPPG